MERTIKPELLKTQLANTLLLDVRRPSDYAASGEIIPGSVWKNPEQLDTWLPELPRDRAVVIYCARGGSVSNSVLDRLQSVNVKARFVEGGIEAWKAAGGNVTEKPKRA